MFNRKLGVVEMILLISNSVVSLLLMLSCLSPFINPNHGVWFALLGLFYPELVIINLIYGGYWVFKTRYYVLISALSILAGINNLSNYWNLNYHTQNSSSANNIVSVKIMTYNVHNFNGLDTPVNQPAYHSILNLIKKQDPDIVVFQEFHQQNTQYRISDSLTKTLHNSDYYFEPFIKTSHDSTGLAIFSKLPIIKKGVLLLSNLDNDNQVIFADIKSPKYVFRIYCVHLQSVKFDAADHLQKLNLIKLAGLDVIFNKLSVAFKARADQTALIKDQAKSCQYPYIFAGDFNDTPISYSVRQMSAGMKNAFSEKGNGLGITYNEIAPGMQIDYIMASQHFNVLDYRIIKQKISDHYPVISKLALR